MDNIQKSVSISWVARILSMLYAMFISIFAMDVFGEVDGFLNIILTLFMHLIPFFLIIIVLILSWNREWIGGIVYTALAIIYIIDAWGKFDWTAYAVIAGPLFLLGILFLIAWKLRKQQMVQ